MRSATISTENVQNTLWDENYFKFCDFDGFSTEGGFVCSDFVSCSFRNVDWYWGLFSGSNFIACQFADCIFRGVSFPDSRFIECKLTNCRFVKDNLNGECDFSKTVAYGCVIEGGEGFKPSFTK
jgi:uncharacterized protein YjbI with pentapeptide repeats